MASFGSFEKSLVVGKGASRLALFAIISGVVGCSEGSTDPLPSAGAGGAGGGGGAVGVSGSSGAASTAGSGGSSGGAGGNAALRTFDFAEAGDVAEWLFVYAEPAGLIAPPAPVTGDAGADAGAPAPAPEGVARAEHDAQAGNPDNGSARLELPFDGPSQKISFEVNVAMADVGVNLAARSITARIRVDSGLALDPMNPAGIKLYVKTGPDSVYADSGFLNLAAGAEWQTLVWPNVSTATFVDTMRGAHAPTDVRQVGIEFATGAAGTYAPAVVHVDTVVF